MVSECTTCRSLCRVDADGARALTICYFVISHLQPLARDPAFRKTCPVSKWLGYEFES